jgi:hypothetical protein
LVIVGIWPDPADNEANIKWVKDYYTAIHPHSGSDGGYINFMSGDDDQRAAANYGANYDQQLLRRRLDRIDSFRRRRPIIRSDGLFSQRRLRNYRHLGRRGDARHGEQ